MGLSHIHRYAESAAVLSRVVAADSLAKQHRDFLVIQDRVFGWLKIA